MTTADVRSEFSTRRWALDVQRGLAVVTLYATQAVKSCVCSAAVIAADSSSKIDIVNPSTNEDAKKFIR